MLEKYSLRVEVQVEGEPPFRVGPGPSRGKYVPRSEACKVRLQDAAFPHKDLEIYRAEGIALGIKFFRKASQKDADKFIAGICDALTGYLYEDDRQLREIHYWEEDSDNTDHYTVVVAKIE